MGKLRITSGKYRGRSVATPAGEGTRPLLTRVRKSLVDILRPRLTGAMVLDLFAGSGAIGFELLSNGACHCVMTELDRTTVALIRRTADDLGAQVTVHQQDALAFLEDPGGRPSLFDIIVVAPPYDLGLQQKTLDLLADSQCLAPAGLVIVQRDVGEPPTRPREDILTRVRERTYGRTVFEFFEPTGRTR